MADVDGCHRERFTWDYLWSNLLGCFGSVTDCMYRIYSNSSRGDSIFRGLFSSNILSIFEKINISENPIIIADQ